jgi:hypothetical protein
MAGEKQAIYDLIDNLVAQAETIRTAVTKIPDVAPSSGDVIRVKVGDNVQAAFDTITKTGGTLLFAPGVHKADLECGERPPDAKLVIFTSDTSNVPPPSKRISPEFLPALAQLQVSRTDHEAFTARNRSRNVAFVNMAFGPPVNPSRTTVQLGGDERELTVPADAPTNFFFDRVYMYGDPAKGAHRGIQAHCNGLRVSGCYVKDYKEIGRDSQAIGGFNGTRNVLLENSFFEASGENIMWGGSDSASPDMTPQDIEMRGCTLSKNYEWMKDPVQPSIKALLETKNVKRFIVDGCVLEQNWARDWPSGVAFMFKACNGYKNEVWATAEDITISNCLIRNVGSPCGLVGYGDSGRPSDRARRITISNLLVYNIDTAPYRGFAHGMPIANPLDGLTVDHVSFIKNGHSFMNTWFDSNQPAGEFLSFTNSVVCLGEYAMISGSNGLGYAAMQKDWKKVTFEGNALQAGNRGMGTMPTSNKQVSVADFDASLDNHYRVKAGSVLANSVKTTDGKLPGADVDAILQRVGDII